ncbi:MAG: EamA family transporter [Anaerolineales bacterium]|nr:EamA family transporter [Anaerolineales bacterium]
MKDPSRLVLSLALLLAILAVSTASIFIRFAQMEAPSLVIAAGRLTLASLVLAPFALTRGRSELQHLTRLDLGLALVSGICLALHFATWISSLETTSIASSVVLVSTAPLWVALLSPLLLGERLAPLALVGMALALAGGSIIGISDACRWEGGLACPPLAEWWGGAAMGGNFLALAGAWTVTGYLIIGRRLRSRMSLVPYIFLVYGIAAVVLVAILLAAGQTPFGYTPMTYLWILLLALVPQLIGHSTYNWALRYLPAALVAIGVLGEPIGSTILGYLIFGESPGWIKVVGGILILAGISLATRQERK